MSKENRRFYFNEEKVIGKDFSDSNTYLWNSGITRGTILTHIYHMYLNRYS